MVAVAAMPEPQVDPVLIARSIVGTLLLSIAVGLYLIYRADRAARFLPYDAARPCRGVLSAARARGRLCVRCRLIDAASAGADRTANGEAAEPITERLNDEARRWQLRQAVASMRRSVRRAGLRVRHRRVLPGDAERPWPAGDRCRQFGATYSIGVVACLAALAARFMSCKCCSISVAYGARKVGPSACQNDDETANRTSLLLAVGCIAGGGRRAVCEEITFRLLLQGWLEKWEDQRLGWRGVDADRERRLSSCRQMAMTSRCSLDLKPTVDR